MSLAAVGGQGPARMPSRTTNSSSEMLKSVATALDVLECFAVDNELVGG